MDPKPPSGRMLLAPSPGGTRAALERPSWPRVDDHVVRPETREELVRGRLVQAAPAKEPHAERQVELDFLLRGCIAPGYVGAADLLTRVGQGSNFATDACIRKAGIDPRTGSRYLEELAFEIVGEQSMRDITERAEDLSERGVRRVIAIFVKTREVREWSPAARGWIVLDPQGTLEDPTLARPIPHAALLDAAEAEKAVVQALRAKKSPEIAALEAEGEARGRAEGEARGRRAALLQIVEARGLQLTAEQRQRIEACTDLATLERWTRAAVVAPEAAAIFERSGSPETR